MGLFFKGANRLYSYRTTRRLGKCGPKVQIDYPATIECPWALHVGERVWIREHAWLNCQDHDRGGQRIVIGDGTYVGRFVHINAYSSVVIESSVLISDRVFISDVHHQSVDDDVPIINQGPTYPKPVLLKSGCWIGVGAAIMPGVTIGRNAVVGANAVVTRDVPDNMVARGIPAAVFPKTSKNRPVVETTV